MPNASFHFCRMVAALLLGWLVLSSSAAAGLRVGDRVYQIAGRDFPDDAAFAKLAKTLPGPLELLVERDGRLRLVVVHFQAEAVKRAA